MKLTESKISETMQVLNNGTSEYQASKITYIPPHNRIHKILLIFPI